jgi:polycomb protein EED
LTGQYLFLIRFLYLVLIDISVAFFGDLILSRACHEDTICLWRIEGFSSDDPPPTALQAPTTYDPSKQTRSAFLPVPSSARPIQYTRLLKFHTPDCGVQFFMRFRIFNEPGKHPILAFCNIKSKIMFWDLERLAAYSRFIEHLGDLKRDKSVPLERPAWLQVRKLRKETSVKGTAVSHLRSSFHAADKESMASMSPDPEGASAGQPYSQKTLDEWASLYDITNPHGALQPHRSIHATLANEELFVGRQVAWSADGEWCVVVGNGNRIVICQRWAKDGKDKTPAPTAPTTS